MTRSIIIKELNASIADIENDILYTNRLKKTKDKVKYLRIVKGYTQEEVAEMIGISSRQVRRVEKILKNI